MVSKVIGVDRAGEGDPLSVWEVLQINPEHPLLEEMNFESLTDIVWEISWKAASLCCHEL